MNDPVIGRFESRHMRMCLIVLMSLALLGITADWTCAAELPPMAGRTNLAAGKTVQFAPAPNYKLTRKGGTDATDLTDGRLTEREDREIWRESLAVGWKYAGRVNLTMDLGQRSRIDEVAMRFVGGSPQPGINIPGWMEVLVSDDGEHYRKVAEFSRFNSGAFDRFNIPPQQGEAWIHALRFKDIDTTARWVGLRFYGSAFSVSDEIYVFGRETTNVPNDSASKHTEAGTGFTVQHPQPYFHKPYITLATNLALPQPIGMTVPAGASLDGPTTLTLDLPAGVTLNRERTSHNAITITNEQEPSSGARRYRIVFSEPRNRKSVRIYMQADKWEHGQTGEMRYRFAHEDWESGTISLPVRAVTVPEAPRAEQLMFGLGWCATNKSVRWPNVLDTWHKLGLNSFPVFGHYIRNKPDDSAPWRLVEAARQRGFKIVNIDSPFHRLVRRRRDEQEIYCQFEDGTTGRKLCLSYRGPYYQEELQRFAKMIARVKPDHTVQDIELWGHRGASDAKRCTRCRADFKQSSYESWDAWMHAKGQQLWTDLIRSARTALKEAGAEARFDTGGYNFRPGDAYDNIFKFSQLYPDVMSNSQVSTYTSLYPYHLQLIGDEVRADRAKLPESDVMPWITPGDAGTFPGDAFQWALLECFANGSRGVYFWSQRMWDAESLIAFNRVVRAIAPVEDVIVEGELAGEVVEVDGVGRVSGMRHDGEMMLLVADYSGRDSDGTIELNLTLPARSAVRDLFGDGEAIAQLDAGVHRLEVPLQGARARLLHIQPVQ